MNLTNIKDILRQTLALVEDAEASEPSSLERDLILQNLRRAYEIVRFDQSETPELSHAPQAKPVATPVTPEPTEECEDEPEIEVELIMADESEEEPLPESDNESEEKLLSETLTPTEAPLPALESLFEEPVTEPIATPAAAEDIASKGKVPAAERVESEITILRPSRSSSLNALYGESPAANATDKPLAAKQCDTERVIGEIFHHDTPTVGDSISRPKGISEGAPIESLRQAIGVADRFMMIRDLFAGDEAAFDAAIERLDSFTSLDEALIHIAENYTWAANSEGAKMLMQILQRKHQL